MSDYSDVKLIEDLRKDIVELEAERDALKRLLNQAWYELLDHPDHRESIRLLKLQILEAIK
jgi:hypothetical protein